MILETGKLSPSQKETLEELMGRKLLDNEAVVLRAITTPATYSPEQIAARDKLLTFLESPRPRPGVSDEEMEAAILEAMRSVRPGYTEVR